MNDKHNIDNLRILGVEMINKANSGHPGIVLGAAPMIYTLFTKHMQINPKNPDWFNRDRFIMGAGHGSALLYSMLHLAGYDLSIEDLKKFRQINSKTPGHPENFMTKGVDATSGPLGQGVGQAVGMALAESHLNAKNKNIDHMTYAIIGDGDLQEGVALEALQFAGRFGLGKLIFLYDSNDIQLDTAVSKTQNWDFKKFCESINIEHILVQDGENIDEIDNALKQAKKTIDKPTIIEIKTIIGKFSTKEGTSAVHGAPIGSDIDNVKKRMNYTLAEFEVREETYHDIQTRIINNSKEKINTWKDFEKNNPNLLIDIENIKNKNFKFEHIQLEKNQATRVTCGNIWNELQKQLPNMIGGSADLSGSTKIKGIFGDYDKENRKNNNINYGVREFSMATLVNGMNLHGGVIPFGSTFFVFADYLKPALRMSAIQKLPSIFILSHDSVYVGEDGPTHQPIDQLAMIRAIPNVNLFRPADENEMKAALESAILSKRTPTVVVSTRQNIVSLEKSDNEKTKFGAYIVHGKFENEFQIISTGAEVSLSIEIAKLLGNTSVVSMPSMDIFQKQDDNYRKTIINQKAKRIAIEAGSSFGWNGFVGDCGLVIALDRFGESGEGNQVYQYLGFDKNKIVDKINKHFNK